MRVGESHSLAGQPINIGCVDLGGSITTGVSKSEIVGEDDHNVRFWSRFGVRRGIHAEGNCNEKCDGEMQCWFCVHVYLVECYRSGPEAVGDLWYAKISANPTRFPTGELRQ